MTPGPLPVLERHGEEGASGAPRSWRSVLTTALRGSFVRNVGVLTVGNAVGAALSLVQGVLVARWLGPESYGLAALIMAYPGLVYSVLDARSSEASVRYLGEFRTRGESGRALAMCRVGYVVDFGVASLAVLAVSLSAPWAASRIVHRPEATGLLVVYSLSLVPRALVGTSSAVLATVGRFATVAALDGVTNLVRVVLVLAFVVAGGGAPGVVWANAIAMAGGGLAYGVIGYRFIRQTWGASWLRRSPGALGNRGKEIVAFLAYNDVYALVGMVTKQLDLALLGYWRNPTEVGYYKLAKSLAVTAGHVIGPLQSVTYPVLVRLWSLEDRTAFRRKLRQLVVSVGLPVGLVILSGLLVIRWGILVSVGAAYLPAVAPTRVLVVDMAWQSAFFWLRPSFLVTARLRAFVLVSGVSTGALALAWVLIGPALGSLALATSLLARTIVHTVTCALLMASWHLGRRGGVDRDEAELR